MRNLSVIFILIILMGSFALAADLLIAPGTLHLNGTYNEEICNNLILSYSAYGDVEGTDLWAPEGTERLPSLYNLSAEDVGVTINYTTPVSLVKDTPKEITVCVTTQNPGIFQGKLYYAPVSVSGNQAGGVGTWLLVNATEISINITLQQGWNLISIPLNLTDKTLPFKSIQGNYSKIFTYNNKWIELKDNDKINESHGYWIKMLNNDTLELVGTVPENTTINLNQGWNLIGYPSLSTALTNETLIDINYSVVYGYNAAWSGYNPLRNNSLNSLKYFIPGYGYWVKSNENTALSIA